MLDEIVGRVPPADWVEAVEADEDRDLEEARDAFDAALARRDRLWEKGGLSQVENAAMLRCP